jgi:aryl-alcohol dehydrogenase-like predicted oxidoreductase
MHYTTFGKTGVQVSSVVLGGHEYLADGKSRGFNEDFALAVTPGFVGKGYGGPKRLELLQAAYELGINYFDVTIDSEKEALGRNLQELPPPHDVFVQTRPEGMLYSYDEGNRKLLDYALLRAEVERVLRLIRRDRIDFFNIGLLSWSIERDAQYFDKLRRNIEALKAEKLIRFALADSFSGEALYMAEIESGIFDAVNVDLNVGDPNPLRTVLPAARQAGMGVLVREVFMKGRLFEMSDEAGIADRSQVAAMALRWTASHAPDCLICGADSADQLRANVAAIEDRSKADLDAELLGRITKTTAYQAYVAERTRRFYPTT